MRLRYLGGAIAPDNQPLSNQNTAAGVATQYQGSFSRQDVMQAETRGLWTADPHSADLATVMNVNADNAPNAAQNTTFIDGAQNLPVTRTGNVTQGSFNPFAVPAGTWSAYFGGSGNYIVTNTAAFTTTQSTFTVECWMCMTAAPGGNPTIVGDMQPVSTANNWGFGPTSNNKLTFYWWTGATNSAVGTTILRRNVWYHIAVSVNANAISLFVNGVPEVMTGTTTLTNRAATTSTIALGQAQTSSQIFIGYVSNLSILSGTAKYAAGVTFNPPTSPLPNNTANQVFLFGQDNIMADENTATTAKTLTFTGAVAASTFSPFYTPYTYKNNTFGASLSFNGTNQYLSLPNNAAFSFGTGDFTIEAFVYNTATPASFSSIIDTRNADGFTPYIFGVNSTLKIDIVYGNSAGQRLTSAASIANNIWTHVAVTRSSGVIRLFINGVVDVNTVTYNSAMNISDIPAIGAGRGSVSNAINGYYLSGFLSNFRLIKGTALYTANFTIPTQPLQAVANTQLLTCQGSAVDSSTNNFTITNTNAVTASTSGPFTTYVNQTFRSWPAGSMYFDGATTYLTLNGSSTLAFGANDFSISMWLYFTTAPAGSNIIFFDGRASGSSSAVSPVLYIPGGSFVITYYTAGGTRISGTTPIRAGQWYYLNLNRSAGSTTMWVNGVQQGAAYPDANVYVIGANRPTIACAGDTVGGSLMSGYIYGLQIRNGTAGGSSIPGYPNFSPNTLPNTKLYLSGVNAGMYDTVGFTDYQTLGNAQVSTLNVKYGSGSMFFDGTGDWLISTVATNNANLANLQLGQEDFTIEAWINVSSFAAIRSVISKGTATTGWTVEISTAGKLSFAQTAVAAVAGNSTMRIGEWYHVAVVRSGSGVDNIKMYVNGVLDYVSAAAVTTNFNQTELLYIGASRTGTTPMLGYIADLRVTKFARYLNNFVPPRATLPKH